jgi:hypothetical protein
MIDVIKSKKEVQLSEIKTKISEARWKQNITKSTINNSIIKSPFNWIVLKKNIEIGQFVNVWSPLIELWTDNVQEIILFVPVKDVKEYLVWKKVNIDIPDVEKKYKWKISHISSITDISTKKLEIKIAFHLNEWDVLPYWTYTKVNIPFKNYIWLLLDVSFIQYDFGEAFIFVKDWIDVSSVVKKAIIPNYCSNELCLINDSLFSWDIIVKKTR